VDIFTEVYSTLIDMLKSKSLDSSWADIEAGLKALCEVAGPNEAKSTSLQNLRDKLRIGTNAARKYRMLAIPPRLFSQIGRINAPAGIGTILLHQSIRVTQYQSSTFSKPFWSVP